MPIPSDTIAKEASSRRALVAACVGNAAEWYDFAIYGALGTAIAPVFFPTDDRATILIAAFAIYGTAFVVRPLGALLLGRRSDLQGRRSVLATLILAMTVATAAVGLLPGYAAIGVSAPCILVLLRASQGVAAGGELGIAAAFMVEHAPDERRGAFAAWHTATLALGVAVGLGVASVLALLPGGDLGSNWWRVAFLFALPLGTVGVYLRNRARETPGFLHLQHSRALVEHPIRETWESHRRGLRTGFALIAAGSLTFNTFFIYLPNHLAATTARSLSAALLASLVGLIAGALAALGLGRLSDRVGRRPVVIGSVSALVVLSVPLTLLAQTGSLVAFAAVETAMGIAVGGTLSVSMLAEMFPAAVRATGLSLTAGLASAMVGGTAPLLDHVLFASTGLEVAPALYCSAVAALALAAVSSWPETAFAALD